MHRFFCPTLTKSSKKLAIIDKIEIHHLRNVIRLKEGEEIVLFNGHGVTALGTIQTIDSKTIEIEILKSDHEPPQSPCLILVCAVPKRNRFDLIVEKATELGVDEIYPLITERTEVKWQSECLQQKQKRYQTIALNAAKQSQRSVIPVVHPSMKFAEFMKLPPQDTLLCVLSLSGQRQRLFDIFLKYPSTKRIIFLVGPEGDFTKTEYALAKEKGYISVSLGDKVLKVETAAITAVACTHVFYRV